jgi:hypothetical protein
MLSLVASLHLSLFNKQVLLICIRFPSGHFDSLATFCWLRCWRNTYLETQILIDNQTTSKVRFCSFVLSGVLAMNCLMEVVINCWESLIKHTNHHCINFVVMQMVLCCLISNLYLVFCINGLHFIFPDNKVQV